MDDELVQFLTKYGPFIAWAFLIFLVANVASVGSDVARAVEGLKPEFERMSEQLDAMNSSLDELRDEVCSLHRLHGTRETTT